MTMQSMTIELDDQTLQALRKTAAARQESLDQVVRSALRAYAQDVTDLPASLSSFELRHAQLREEAAAWRNLPALERQRYGADFVAVLQGRVVDHDGNRLALVQRVHTQFGDTPVLITPANAEAPRGFVPSACATR